MKNITRIVIDGGPCAGKTSGLAAGFQKIEERDIIPLIVPETPTLLIQSGITPKLIGMNAFQDYVLKKQMESENYWNHHAELLSKKFNKKIVLFFDRGLLTPIAYLGNSNNFSAFQELSRKRIGLGIEEMRGRYDAVLHMETAAIGAEVYYTLENNTARTESIEEARVLDQRTREAWLGHKCLRIIPNEILGQKISFDEKMNKLLSEIYGVIGHPIPLEIEDKYLLESFDPSLIPGKYEIINIIQTYLSNRETEERVRERQSRGGRTFYHTTKKEVTGTSQRIEVETKISEKDYQRFLQRRDSSKKVIQKMRYCFIFNNQYFEIDEFKGDLEGYFICEREKTHENDSTHLPGFLRVKGDVTNSPAWKNYNLANK